MSRPLQDAILGQARRFWRPRRGFRPPRPTTDWGYLSQMDTPPDIFFLRVFSITSRDYPSFFAPRVFRVAAIKNRITTLFSSIYISPRFSSFIAKPFFFWYIARAAAFSRPFPWQGRVVIGRQFVSKIAKNSRKSSRKLQNLYIFVKKVCSEVLHFVRVLFAINDIPALNVLKKNSFCHALPRRCQS